jgi:hypothetical protein
MIAIIIEIWQAGGRCKNKTMSEVASIEDLVKEISTSGLKGNRSQYDIGSQMNILKQGWDAVDRWVSVDKSQSSCGCAQRFCIYVHQITATMRARKGVHLPTLCKMTWEYLDEPSGSEVRMRPVFVLTESFLRGLRLAS